MTKPEPAELAAGLELHLLEVLRARAGIVCGSSVESMPFTAAYSISRRSLCATRCSWMNPIASPSTVRIFQIESTPAMSSSRCGAPTVSVSFGDFASPCDHHLGDALLDATRARRPPSASGRSATDRRSCPSPRGSPARGSAAGRACTRLPSSALRVGRDRAAVRDRGRGLGLRAHERTVTPSASAAVAARVANSRKGRIMGGAWA